MKKLIFIFIGTTIIFSLGSIAQNLPAFDYTKFVNVFIGSGAVDANSLSPSGARLGLVR